jgi:N-acetylglucosamine malate deacetylase 2
VRLADRAIGRARRVARDLADLQLRRRLRVRARLPRAAASLDGLFNGALLVVVAHPDDEAIAAAALLGRARSASLICVSSGAPRKASHARKAGFDSWIDYGAARRMETCTALALLERPVAPLQNLGIADQDVAFEMAPLARHLTTGVIARVSHVITHAYEGGHPDHDSVALAVHAACALVARTGCTPPLIVEAPLYSAPGGDFIYQDFVPNLDAGPELRLRLSAEEVDRKQRMFEAYITQQDQLDKFSAEKESFRIAPRYHFSAPPHAGKVGFDQFGWSITGKVWRRAAWEAMRELDLLDELA